MTTADLDDATPADMDPSAAAELMQELALVTRSLFVHLLPDSADHALSGVPGWTNPEVVGVSTPPPAPAPSTESVVPAASVPVGETSQDFAIEMPSVAAIPVVVAQYEPVIEAAPEVAPIVPSSVASLPLPSMAMLAAIEVMDVPSSEAPPPEEPPVEALAVPVVLGPVKPDHRSQAMLAEIGFLDEETPES